MKRTPLNRGAPLQRRTRLRPRNPKRKAKLRAKQFAAQAQLCRESPCCVPGCHLQAEPHHVRSRGAGGDDSSCVPLCRGHHNAVHSMGRNTFAIVHGVDLVAVARGLAAGLGEGL